MFDFEKLDVYQLIKTQNINVLSFLKTHKNIEPLIVDQWKRASLSILFNLAEGTGRMTDEDKKHFITISRGSVYESVAILDLLKGLTEIDDPTYQNLYTNYESISKMLLGMHRSYSK